MFVDHVKISVQSGNGGAGCVSFRREKFIPKGGPDGGDGGHGGHVTLVAESGLSTLSELRYKKHYNADNGARGGGGQCTGRSGDELLVRVPVGTVVHDAESGAILADLTEEGQRWVSARGGKGGLGNQHFATSRRQTPRYAQPGMPGEGRELALELRLLADVGLVGLPNAGKSTLISVISAARPKVADYPFTTLIPNLGVVNWGNFDAFVMADIPGLITGASQGKGLGDQFLRHVERTRILLFMADVTGLTEETPDQALDTLREELKAYDPALMERPFAVAATKMDAADPDALALARDWAESHGVRFFEISAVAGTGIDPLVTFLGQAVHDAKARQPHGPGTTPVAPAETERYRQIWGEEGSS